VGGEAITRHPHRGEGPSRREEGVITIIVHFFREMLDNGLGLHMQVSNHCVAVPPTKDVDEVHINFAA
jgi:hypothetical protein